ncbi:MAG TPA: glycosyltransferase family 4 protein [Candidatus Bathyarchaeia archaeon]|nr:glycosyltransferase family 4 protein [Candidatus Bathyarchaeia archaeon]
MKILMLTSYLPYPLFSGGQIRTYNLLKNLVAKHEITLFSFIRQEEEREHIKKLEKFCFKVKVFKRRPAWDLRNILLAGFSPFPFVMISTYLSWTVRQAIRKELEEFNYDLIHAEPFYMMPNIPKTKIPILLVEQTIEYLVYKKFVDNFPNPFFKTGMYFDVVKLKFWEERYWRKATSLVAMSKEDKFIMQKAAPKQTIDIVANGVDTEFFDKAKVCKPKIPTILFVGNFKWLPNKDAAKFLTHELWPLIKQKIPEAKLWIVGKNPTPDILELARKKDVFVQSNIKDIRTAFSQASVLLAPIRNGRGTKYKVLEAMASKLPVVTTPLGIEGIGAINGKQVLIARKADGLVDKTVKILQNPKLGQNISQSSYKLIKEKYNWQLISSSLDKIYKKLGVSSSLIN